MATKLDRILTYCEGLLGTKSHDSLITRFGKSSDKLKPLYLHYQDVFGQQTWQGSDLL